MPDGKKISKTARTGAPALDKILSGLNRAQKEAVTYGRGPLLIVAGAGTGKTRVITSRIAYLITAKIARPEEILALTFTEKAAQEMEERVDEQVPYGFTDTWIGTFHAFGDRVLRDRALELGLTTSFRVLTRPEQLIFLKEHLFELPLKRYRPLGNPTKHLQAILTLISRAKDEDISPEEYLAYAEGLKKTDPAEAVRQLELAAVYQKYQELLAAGGCIDFGDQIRLILELMRKRPEVRTEFQKKFKYILVDEFQDTNYAQFKLIRLLAGPGKNLTVVADDDQSIYKWRGAAISNVLGFKDVCPQAKEVVLVENYRSNQEILDKAYRLIRFNDPERLEVKSRINKKLVAKRDDRDKKGKVKLHLFDTISAEADAVAELIETKVREEGYRYKDLAILVRNNDDSIPYIQALNLKKIPYRFSGSRGLYDKPEVRLCLSFLHLVADPHDPTVLFDLAASDIYGVKPLVLSRLASAARYRNRSLFQAFANLEQYADQLELDEDSEKKIRAIMSDLEHFAELAARRPTGEVLYEFLMKKEILIGLTREADAENEQKIKNLAKFFEIIRRTSASLNKDRVREFIPYLELLREAGDNPAEAEIDWDLDAVPILTVHKAKGLEFPVVFLGSLVKGKFPVTERSDALEIPAALVKEHLPEGDYHLAEERRLFYVAMTRARRELHLLSSRDMGGARERKVSPFVCEALDILPDQLPYQKTGARVSLARQAPLPLESPPTIVLKSEALKLSHQQIDDYRTCPLKYKYVHILHIPIRLHHTVIYGAALHQAVQRFLQRQISSHSMSEKELLAVFRDNWKSEGWLSRQHEEQRLAAGEAALKRFFREEVPRDSKPAYVEKAFSCKLAGIKFGGRWDRIDILPDGSAAIIDYKSSEIKEQKKADVRVKESSRDGQLGLYALAYQKINNVLPQRLELRFLESGLVGRAEPSPKHLAKLEETVREVAAKICAGHFPPEHGYESCRFCAYSQICPQAEID